LRITSMSVIRMVGAVTMERVAAARIITSRGGTVRVERVVLGKRDWKERFNLRMAGVFREWIACKGI